MKKSSIGAGAGAPSAPLAGQDHGPIQAEFLATMNAVAGGIDEIFNGEARGTDRTVAFVLLTAKFGEIDGGRVNYISNGEREDIVSMMKETIARFEGRVIEAPSSKVRQ